MCWKQLGKLPRIQLVVASADLPGVGRPASYLGINLIVSSYMLCNSSPGCSQRLLNLFIWQSIPRAPLTGLGCSLLSAPHVDFQVRDPVPLLGCMALDYPSSGQEHLFRAVLLWLL